MAEVVISAVTSLVREALQLQGARWLDLERARSGDTSDEPLPELRLNLCLVSEVFVQILTTGVGALAFIWATVVLLGGFSASLDKADFWVITGIVFVQAAKVVGINSNTEAIFFAQVPSAFLELGAEHSTPWGRRRPVAGDASCRDICKLTVMGLGSAWVTLLTRLLELLPLVAGSSCITLSIFRLVIITTRHKHGGDGSYSSNVMGALIFFYALVLAQGGLFIIWVCILFVRLAFINQVCSQYKFQDKDTKKLIDKYISRTSGACIKAGVLHTINRKLVSFAVDLLQSEYSQDRISAILLLHTLTSKGAPEAHKARALAHIQSSPDCMARIFVLLGSKSAINEESRVRLAQIVVELASELRLSDIDRATESISSLIDPNLTKISKMANSAKNDGQRVIDIGDDQQETDRSPSITNGEETKPLIIHGLMILAKLAANPDNCTKIFRTKGMFSKITMPIRNELCSVLRNDDIAIEITEKSLLVVSKLVSGTDETNKNIRKKIRKDGENSIRSILSYEQKYNRLKVPTIKILAKLALHRDTTKIKDISVGKTMVDFINSLMGLFINGQCERRLRNTAGKALALLAMDSTSYCATIMNFNTGTSHSAVEQLCNMFSDTSYRIAIAQLLRQFCVNCRDDEIRGRLASVKSILNEVLKVIVRNVDQEVNVNQLDSPQRNRSLSRQTILALRFQSINTPSSARRKTLVAFLGLAVEICDKLIIGSSELDAAVEGLRPLSGPEFVEKLWVIIDMCSKASVVLLNGRRASADYLVMIKSVTKFCTWVLRTKPGYTIWFQEKHVAQKLKDAMEAMRGLELGVLLTCRADEMADYETLSSVVEEARSLMLMPIPPQQPGNDALM